MSSNVTKNIIERMSLNVPTGGVRPYAVRYIIKLQNSLTTPLLLLSTLHTATCLSLGKPSSACITALNYSRTYNEERINDHVEVHRWDWCAELEIIPE